MWGVLSSTLCGLRDYYNLEYEVQFIHAVLTSDILVNTYQRVHGGRDASASSLCHFLWCEYSAREILFYQHETQKNHQEPVSSGVICSIYTSGRTGVNEIKALGC